MGDLEHKARFGRVVDKLASLSPDELAAHEHWLDRVNRGATKYLRFEARFDDRNMRQEGSEELLDFLAYLSFDYVKRELARQERIRCFAADEGARKVEEAMRPMTEGE